MDHLDDVRQRRGLSHRVFEYLSVAAREEPVVDQSLRRRSERLTSDRAGTQNLHEVAQHLAVVDNARKYAGERLHVIERQDGAEKSRNVLHNAALAGVNRRLGDEFRVEALAKLDHSGELL